MFHDLWSNSLSVNSNKTKAVIHLTKSPVVSKVFLGIILDKLDNRSSWNSPVDYVCIKIDHYLYALWCLPNTNCCASGLSDLLFQWLLMVVFCCGVIHVTLVGLMSLKCSIWSISLLKVILIVDFIQSNEYVTTWNFII